MRKTTPDWLHQSLWFVSGTFATGAVWYFLSQGKYDAALWSAGGAAVFASMAIAVSIRNDKLRSDAQPKGQGDPFFLRIHTLMLFAYPGLLVYRYTGKPGQLLAPVGLAAVIEATNKRATAAKVFSYFLDAAIQGQWTRLHNLQALNPRDFFWIGNNSLKAATRIDFSGNGFDIKAREHTLSPGESIKGWVFLEWPAEHRKKVPEIKQLRMTIENSHGETQTTVLTLPTTQEPGESGIAGGEWHVMPKSDVVDLSGVPIMPHMDLLSSFRNTK